MTNSDSLDALLHIVHVKISSYQRTSCKKAQDAFITEWVVFDTISQLARKAYEPHIIHCYLSNCTLPAV